ncbi:hypothetical protein ACSBR2_032531 [Camellia fascicularis]
MGNNLRCCLACVLPCGALDLIRIVHLNGHVQEITSPVTAGEVLKNNPNHVLTKPSSQGVVRRILILSPDSELKRGTIYFLIPTSSLPEKKNKKNHHHHHHNNNINPNKSSNSMKISKIKCNPDEILVSEKKSSRRDRRSRRVGVWRPHLQSISED